MKKILLFVLMILFSTRAWAYSADSYVTSLDASSATSTSVIPIMGAADSTLSKITVGNLFTGVTISGTSTIAGYVPYSGATGSLNLGAQVVYSTGTSTFNTSGNAGNITGNLDPDQLAGDTIDDNSIDNSLIGNGVAGDVTITDGSWAVGDNSHAHTASTVSGLSTVDFTSGVISNWTNDSGYITTSSLTAYVPYTGASGSVNLGSQTINAGTGTFTTVSATTFTGALTGNASTSTALAANPAACEAGKYVNDLDANGTLTCGTPSGSGGGLSGSITASSIGNIAYYSATDTILIGTSTLSIVGTTVTNNGNFTSTGLVTAAGLINTGTSTLTTISSSGITADGVTVDTEAYGSGFNGDTTVPTKDAVYDWGHVLDVDDDGLADGLDTNAVDTITEVAAALKDGSGDCASGLICLGDHTHTAYQGTLTNSAGLAGALNDETGSGLTVFGSNPTLSGVTITGTSTIAGYQTTVSATAPAYITAGTVTVSLNTAYNAGYVSSGAGQNAQVWKTDADGTPGWRADSTGGTPAFNDISSGTNSTASMAFSTGGSLNMGTGTLLIGGSGTVEFTAGNVETVNGYGYFGTGSNTVNFTGKGVTVKTVAEATALAAGSAKAQFRVPPELNGMKIVATFAHLYTVGSTISTVNFTGTAFAGNLLSTAITIDANESDSATAATAAVIDTTKQTVSTADVLSIDVTAAGTGAKGLDVGWSFK